MKKQIILTVIFAFLLSSLPNVVKAYDTINYTFDHNTITVYYDGLSLTGKVACTHGANSWNGLDAGFLNTNNSANADVYCSQVNAPNAAWDGTTSIEKNVSSILHCYMSLNSGVYTWNDSDALQSVAAHEFGHVFGLDEQDLYTRRIMNRATYGSGSRYGAYRLTVAQDDDKTIVNRIY